MSFGGTVVHYLDAGLPITAVGGLHPGCYELFAHEPIRTIGDLKGRRVGIQTLASSGHLYVSIMAKQVGLDPKQDIEWVVPPDGKAKEQSSPKARPTPFSAFRPSRRSCATAAFNRVILNTLTDRPWSQYFCCMMYGNRAWVRDHPVATKRFLRARLQGRRILQRRARGRGPPTGRWRFR